jgi:acyl-CoA synthetase (AMP-forming)/AMP-acid ligase II
MRELIVSKLTMLTYSNREARLVDPNTNKDVTVGQEGELWVRGPVVMMYVPSLHTIS